MIFYDFEVVEKDWLAVFIDMMKKKEYVIINSHDKLKALYEANRKNIWVGFNNRHYDQYIMKGILLGMNPKKINDWIIVDNKEGWQYSRAFNKLPMINYDVMPSNDETMKTVGLKTMEGFLGSNIKETDVDFRIKRKLTPEEIEQMVKYCRHDVEQTIKVFLEKVSEFNAVHGIIQAFPKETSLYDIGDSEARITAKVLGCSKTHFGDEFDFFFLPCLKLKKYKYVQEWFAEKRKEALEMGLQDFDKKDKKTWYKSQNFETVVAGIPHTFGFGGLHGASDKPIHRKGQILHVDVNNYYPSMLIAWGLVTRAATNNNFKMVYDTRKAITADDIVGIQVDYKNKTFKRLAGAANLSKGSDFDKFTMFGGRKRCNVADDGSIVAWYGDADYKEDGSMGQVMVYQPKFYYLVCPVEYDPIDTGIGYHLRKANYYVSEKPRAGFRLHPAFYDAAGNELEFILDSAFEGSIYDASASAYLLNDEQVMTVGEDKFSSIAGTKPASGLTQNLTRPNIEIMAQNRGANWHGDFIKPTSARQLLMIIEGGIMNTQTAYGQGVVSIPDNGSYNCSSITGSTSELGNTSGRASKTINTKGDASTTETVDGKTAVSWRGTENPWGNIWKFVYGINFYCTVDKPFGGYVCTDLNFAESKNSGNYENIGFTLPSANGYISAIGYSTKYDWLFLPSEVTGNSSLPVGDYYYQNNTWNGYRVALLGCNWNGWDDAGGFYWTLCNGVGSRDRSVGGRLVYIPTRDSATYTAAIEAWEQKMAA